MAYFEKLPFTPYPIDGKFRVLRDITLNIRFKKEFIENINAYAEYDFEDYDTPEIVSEKLYGDPNLYWVLMLFNQRYDYVNDFPLSSTLFDEFVTRKYGVGKEYDQHILNGKPHYRTPEGLDCDSDWPRANMVTNYEYEFEQNEKKRRIKIVDPQLINQITTELQTIYNDRK